MRFNVITLSTRKLPNNGIRLAYEPVPNAELERCSRLHWRMKNLDINLIIYFHVAK